MSAEFGMDFITHHEDEYLAIEISFRRQRLCVMYRRKDDDLIEIEFVDDHLILQPPVCLRFPLNQFLQVVEEAREELMALKLPNS